MSYWFDQMETIKGRTYPEVEIVIAWNQPMVKLDGRYVFGMFVEWDVDSDLLRDMIAAVEATGAGA